MERSKLIKQLEFALGLATHKGNDEVAFDIDNQEFHIIFDDDNDDNDENETPIDDGEYVKSISYLAEWLGVCLDQEPRLSIGIFQSENPKETGVAYEFEEGSKLTKHLLNIAQQDEMWYLSIYRSWMRREDSPLNYVFEQMEATLGFGSIDLQIGMLRLLPGKPNEISIESLTPPLGMAETYPEFKVAEDEAFDILSSLYDFYLDLDEDEDS